MRYARGQALTDAETHYELASRILNRWGYEIVLCAQPCEFDPATVNLVEERDRVLAGLAGHLTGHFPDRSRERALCSPILLENGGLAFRDAFIPDDDEPNAEAFALRALGVRLTEGLPRFLEAVDLVVEDELTPEVAVAAVDHAVDLNVLRVHTQDAVNQRVIAALAALSGEQEKSGGGKGE